MNKSNPHTHNWHFDTTYSQLPEDFFAFTPPAPVQHPKLLIANRELAEELGLNPDQLDAAELVGNQQPEGATPLAQAYAGHQFGHFTMLGDGRAILLGEHLTPKGRRVDIQLKGAGPTPYSRRGDGRATVKAMLREFLISEAMHGLGIPSSRSLAVVGTGELVYRELTQPGAVLTRVMSSHLRVGTFEFAKRFLEKEKLAQLVDYTINRHFPELVNAESTGEALLRAVMEKQLNLILHWMRVGFIHGVMNTDNMSICGETFDYGPCAFMNAYNPGTVFSSIDTQGRYAYGNQPYVAQWNLSVLASALLDFIDSNREKAIEKAKAMLDEFMVNYQHRWNRMMCTKIGLPTAEQADIQLIHDLLNWMQQHEVDYTHTFLVIMGEMPVHDKYHQEFFTHWLERRLARLAEIGYSQEESLTLMRGVNPVIIPRNHQVERILDQASMQQNYSEFQEFLRYLRSPYQFSEGIERYQEIPPDSDRGYQTFCGT
jgi:serine/tyrosine/threonine adenylyltransferase